MTQPPLPIQQMPQQIPVRRESHQAQNGQQGAGLKVDGKETELFAFALSGVPQQPAEILKNPDPLAENNGKDLMHSVETQIAVTAQLQGNHEVMTVWNAVEKIEQPPAQSSVPASPGLDVAAARLVPVAAPRPREIVLNLLTEQSAGPPLLMPIRSERPTASDLPPTARLHANVSADGHIETELPDTLKGQIEIKTPARPVQNIPVGRIAIPMQSNGTKVKPALPVASVDAGEATLATAPGQAVRPATVPSGNIEQAVPVVGEVQERPVRMTNGSKRQLVIRLEPERFGRVTVYLAQRGEKLEVRLVPERASAAELLKTDSSVLSRLLKAAGAANDSVSVHIVEPDRPLAPQPASMQGATISQDAAGPGLAGYSLQKNRQENDDGKYETAQMPDEDANEMADTQQLEVGNAHPRNGVYI